jgi:RNA polymerase sigma factor (sigma-70 family)
MTWRVPPRWSSQDWREEIRAEGAAAAVAAVRDFNPELRVPLEAYLRMRMMGQVLVRYRKEWTYALRQYSCSNEALGMPSLASDFGQMMREDLTDAISHLSERDRSLIERIYWSNETEAEIGRSLGLTQQAVNKRKQSIVRALREMIESSRI